MRKGSYPNPYQKIKRPGTTKTLDSRRSFRDCRAMGRDTLDVAQRQERRA